MMAATSDQGADATSMGAPAARRPFPIGLAARYAVLIGTVLLTIFPLVWLVITSLRIPADIFAVPVHIIPASVTWRQYVNVFTQYNLAGYLWNTVVVSLATVVFVTVLAVPCAYAMARFRLPGHRVVVTLLLIMRMIPVVALAPGLGASAVITFLLTWSDLLIALTLASSENAQTVPVGLTNFVSQSTGARCRRPGF